MNQKTIIAPYAAGVIINQYGDSFNEGQFVSAQEMMEITVGPQGRSLGESAVVSGLALLRQSGVLESRADPALGGLHWVNVPKLRNFAENYSRSDEEIEILLNYFKSNEWIKRAKRVCNKYSYDLYYDNVRAKQQIDRKIKFYAILCGFLIMAIFLLIVLI